MQSAKLFENIFYFVFLALLVFYSLAGQDFVST